MKKHLKKAAALSMAAIMAAAAAGCGSSSTETAAETSAETEAADSSEASESSSGGEAADGTTYRIGLLQYVQHDALDKCRDGFIAALEDSGISYELDDQNAAGDTPTCTTIAQ